MEYKLVLVAEGNTPATSTGCIFIQLWLVLPLDLLLSRRGWKRSPAAALLFKQLLPASTDACG
jgi:hypothetical protein